MPKAVENLIYNVQQLLHNQHVKYSWSMQARLRGKKVELIVRNLLLWVFASKCIRMSY